MTQAIITDRESFVRRVDGSQARSDVASGPPANPVAGPIGDAHRETLTPAMDIEQARFNMQRLAAHLAHFEQMLAQGGAVGKKLEFLLQEMLREVNTAASKCREAGDGDQVVEAKAAIERLREQCANLE